MVATIKLFGDKELKKSLKAAGKAYAKERKAVMTKILRSVVVPAVKRNVKAKFKAGKRLRKIGLPQKRVVTLAGQFGVTGEVYPLVGFMSSFETGKDRVAQKGRSRYFKVPLPGAFDGLVGNEALSRSVVGGLGGAKSFLRKSKRGNLIIFRRNFGDDITPIFVLKKRLKTPKRPFLGPAADSVAPTVAERLGSAYVAAVNRA